ncbi:MAG: hypothetical protein RIM99_15415 [Cyclobacteriaceae bacterium]
MDRAQINRLEMFQSANEYLDSHTEVWNGIPIIGAYKNELSSLIATIKDLNKAGDSDRVIFESSLRMLKKSVSDKMDILDDTMEAYAEDIEDEFLRRKAANTSTDYFGLSNDAFESKVKTIISLLESNVEGMKPYGMTQVQIDDAKLTFNDFQVKCGNTRTYQVSHSSTSTNTNELFTEADRYISRLDKVLKRFRRSNPTFYMGYLASRQVIEQ